MAYSSIADLTRWIEEDELVRLCTIDPNATLQSAEVVAVCGEAIQNADARIDSFLLGRWPGLREYVPVPAEINRISAMLAVYHLYLRRRAVSGDWRQSYEDCIAGLRSAARGESSLGLDETGAVAGGAEASYRTDAAEEDRVYTEERLEKF